MTGPDLDDLFQQPDEPVTAATMWQPGGNVLDDLRAVAEKYPSPVYVAPVGTGPGDPTGWTHVGWAKPIVFHTYADAADAHPAFPAVAGNETHTWSVELTPEGIAAFRSAYALAPPRPVRRRPRPRRAARARQARRYLHREAAAGRPLLYDPDSPSSYRTPVGAICRRSGHTAATHERLDAER